MTSPFSEEEFNTKTEQDLVDELYKIVSENYKNDAGRNATQAFPVIKNVFENEGDRYERIVVPFTDGTKTIRVVTNLKEAYESEAKSLVNDFEKNITLAIIDENWKDHLRRMDELKQTVQNATYEQKDPLLVYKFEAFELFQETIDKINKEVLSFLFKGKLPTEDESQISEAREQQREKLDLRKDEVQNSTQQAFSNARNQQTQEQQIVETVVREQPKIGRNERVTIKNVMSGEEKEVKYKQAIPLIEQGTWVLYNK